MKYGWLRKYNWGKEGHDDFLKHDPITPII